MVFANPAIAAVQVTPQGDTAGLAGGRESSPSLEEIADKVFQLESSSDRNDSCHSIGKHNGFGFRQNKRENVCYNFTGEVRELVMNWFDSKLKNGVPLENALCIYNQGIDTAQCDYVSKFKTL